MKALDRQTLFESQGLNRDLVGKSVRGGMATVGSQGLQFLLQTVSTAVLARLLTPADYGLVGMVTVVVNFAGMFKDAGLSMATVQKEEIRHEQISTLFWINVLVSAALSLCVLISSPLVAWFYGKSELTAVTAALSLSFIISGLTIQHHALLQRHMRFGAVAGIQIASRIVTLVVTVLLAWMGCRYWALVGGTLASALAHTMLNFYFCPWIPGRMQKGTGVREMLKFGGHVSAFNFVNYFSRNADSILIGRTLGADALGLYTRAYQLFMMPISQIRGPIERVSIPALCTIRNDQQRYRNYYQRAVFAVAALSMPLVGFTIVFADNIIVLILGKQWYGAVRIFQILAGAGFVQAAVQIGRGLPLMSMGFHRRYFRFGVVQSVTTVLGMIIGLRWGITGVAAGYGIAFCLLTPFTVGWCLRGSPVNTRDWLFAVHSPALATLVMVPAMIWVRSLLLQDIGTIDLSPYANLKVMAIGGAAGVAVYLLSLLLLPTGRDSAISIVKQFRSSLVGSKISVTP